MSKFKNIALKIPIQSFLIIIILIFTIIPTSFNTFVLYQYTKNTLTKNHIEDYMNAVFLEINDNLSVIIQELDTFTLSLLSYGKFQSANADADLTFREKKAAIDDTFQKILSERSIVSAIDFIASDGTIFHYGENISHPDFINYLPSLSNNMWTLHQSSIRANNNYYFLIGKRVYNYNTSYELGSVVFYIDEKMLNLAHSQSSSGKNTFFVSVDNIIISHPQKQYIGTSLYIPTFSSKDKSNSYSLENEYTYFSHTINNKEISNNIVVSGLASNEFLFDTINRSIKYTLVLATVLSLLAIVLTLIITHRIVAGISSLKKSISGFTNDYQTVLESPDNNEISVLEGSFYKMANDIKKLISEIEIEKEKQRTAEITALQSQINPHFIYNALDSISWKAKENYQYEIDDMIITLSTFFRLGLHNGDNIIKLSDELEHVKCYLEIEATRFPDLFDFEFDIEDGLENVKILKIVLQPIVENSIKHAFKNISYMGHILIKVFRNNDMVEFNIIDNGIGTLQATNGDIPKSQNENGGYGLYNVNARLETQYSSECGIKFYSSPQKGTLVKFKIKP